MVGSFSVSLGTQITYHSFCSPILGVSFHMKQKEAGAKKNVRTKWLFLQLSLSLISLPRSFTHTSTQHLICQNLVTCPRNTGKCTFSGHITTQIISGLVLCVEVEKKEIGVVNWSLPHAAKKNFNAIEIRNLSVDIKTNHISN